jgi:hypothetical protein
MCLPSLLVLSGPLVVVKTSVGFNTDSEDPLVCREEKNTTVSRPNQGIQETSDWKRKTQLSADYRKEFKRQRVENEIQEFMPKENNVLLTLKSEQKKTSGISSNIHCHSEGYFILPLDLRQCLLFVNILLNDQPLFLSVNFSVQNGFVIFSSDCCCI